MLIIVLFIHSNQMETLKKIKTLFIDRSDIYLILNFILLDPPVPVQNALAQKWFVKIFLAIIILHCFGRPLWKTTCHHGRPSAMQDAAKIGFNINIMKTIERWNRKTTWGGSQPTGWASASYQRTLGPGPRNRQVIDTIWSRKPVRVDIAISYKEYFSCKWSKI